MVHEKRLAILDSLMAVAWSDGSYNHRERALMTGFLEAMGASAGPGASALVADAPTKRRPLAEVLTSEEAEYLY